MPATNITKRLQIINDLNEELAKVRMLLQETLENDSSYQEMEEEATKVREQFKEKKAKIMLNPAIAPMEEQMKTLRQEIKENKEALAQELADYYRENGVLEIVDDEGNTKRIIFSVKLVNG